MLLKLLFCLFWFWFWFFFINMYFNVFTRIHLLLTTNTKNLHSQLMFQRFFLQLLTGKEHGLSKTTRSLSTNIILIGWSKTGVSCLFYNFVFFCLFINHRQFTYFLWFIFVCDLIFIFIFCFSRSHFNYFNLFWISFHFCFFFIFL